MHSHLHTPYNVNCEEIMTALDECHARGFLYKALGNCNEVKREVNRCLAAERYDRAKRNREEARGKRRRIEEIWARERELEKQVSSSSASTSAGSADASSSKS